MKQMGRDGAAWGLLAAGIAGPAGAQVVTVAASGEADEATIQAAIASLAPGGARDDGDRGNNVVRILDEQIYREALAIEGMGLTVESIGPARPRIITSLAAATALGNPAGRAVRVDSDDTVILRGLILLPDASDPAEGAMLVDNLGTTAPGYSFRLEDVLIAANDGLDRPISADGFTDPGPDAVPYLTHGIDFNDVASSQTPSISMLRTVITGATSPWGELVQVFANRASVTIEEGCVFSFSASQGFRFGTAEETVAQWRGTADAPIIFHGNGQAAIESTGSSTRAVGRLEYVAFTRNSLDREDDAIMCVYDGPEENVWRHVTIAGTSASNGTDDPIDGPFRVATTTRVINCVIAGDGGEGPLSPRNLMNITNGNVIADGTLIDVSHGATTLNRAWQREQGDAEDGLAGGVILSEGAGWSGAAPDFISLDPGNANYLRVTNPELAFAGPDGGPITGAGSFAQLPFKAIADLSGDLQSYMGQFYIPPRSGTTDIFQQPSPDQLMIFNNAWENIMDAQYQQAASLLDLIAYDLEFYVDTASNDAFVVLDERNGEGTWGGLFVVDLSPERKLFVQSPHPLFDGTRTQAQDIFMDTNAFAFSQSGTHRLNSDIVSPCSGTFAGGAPYTISDVAHNADTYFQGAHEMAHNFYTDTVSVNVHGMGQTADPSDVVISNGTGDFATEESLSRNLAAHMNATLTAAGDSRFAVSHQEPGNEPIFSGSTNTQGRYSHGSHAPCTVFRDADFPERFIHMEQAPSVRSGSSSNWGFVEEAYIDLVDVWAATAPPTPEPAEQIAVYALNGDLLPELAGRCGAAFGDAAFGEDRADHPQGALRLENSGYVTIPDFEYVGADREFSLSLWLWAMATSSAFTFQYFFSHGATAEDGSLVLPNSLFLYRVRQDGELRARFILQDGTLLTANTGAAMPEQQWSHVVLTYSQTTGTRIYLNGSLVLEDGDHRLRDFDPEGPIFLGARSDLDPDRFMTSETDEVGLLDDLRIFRSALTEAEVGALNQEPPAASRQGAWVMY